MKFVRIYWEKRGGHVWVRVFSGEGPGFTLALHGELCFDDKEWTVARAKLSRIADELIEDRR